MTKIATINTPSTIPVISKKNASLTPPSNTKAISAAIEDTLNLSARSRNFPKTFQSLNKAEQNAYLQNLARLLKAGIVGTETLQVRGKSYQSFASTRFVDPEITHAKTDR